MNFIGDNKVQEIIYIVDKIAVEQVSIVDDVFFKVDLNTAKIVENWASNFEVDNVQKDVIDVFRVVFREKIEKRFGENVEIVPEKVKVIFFLDKVNGAFQQNWQVDVVQKHSDVVDNYEKIKKQNPINVQTVNYNKMVVELQVSILVDNHRTNLFV